ncbi:MAG TPA: alpha/beta fold hydrolase, partial [Candidatus Koribacter sp.]
MRKILIRLFIALGALYAGICTFFYFVQDAMVFPAPKHFEASTPAAANLAFEDLHIPVNGTEQIHAWYIPADAPSDKVLLFFHGNGYCIEQTVNAPVGELVPLHNTGANVLMADYRGYGTSSPGTATEAKVDEDARAALRYLTQERKVPLHNIIIVGRSIGTGVATELAKENPNAGGVILISPFTSTIDIGKTV